VTDTADGHVIETFKTGGESEGVTLHPGKPACHL
jgi:hypothetical protein